MIECSKDTLYSRVTLLSRATPMRIRAKMEKDTALEFERWRERKKTRVNELLDRFIDAHCSSVILEKALRHALFPGGKRMRPLIIYAASEALGVEASQVDPVSAAIEMMHSYSLVHDDLPSMDDDDFRRGKPAVHKEFGEATAVLTGDALLTYSFEVLADGVTDLAIPDWTKILAKAGGAEGMIYGQLLDIESSESLLSLKELELMHRKKTGALFSASVELVTALRPGESFPELHLFADHLGLCFQIKDDLLDVQGNPEVTGKPAGSDKKNNRSTFVSILGEEEAERRLEYELELSLGCLQKIEGDTTNLENLARLIANRSH